MRGRRWLTWLVFVICVIAVLEALGWVTWQAVRLERAEREARAEAEFQETIRLALWRMESEVTPLLAKESVRPYFEYRAFYQPGVAYERMWEVHAGGPMMPSAMLEAGGGEYVKLYFQVEPDGSVSSPQVPTGELRELAEGRYIDPEFLVLASERLSELRGFIAGGYALARRLTPPPPGRFEQTAEGPAVQQRQKLAADYAARQQAAQSANAYESVKGGALREAETSPLLEAESAESRMRKGFGRARGASEVTLGAYSAVWVPNSVTGTLELVMFREVEVGGGRFQQGMWMDWPALRARLRDVIEDLLPEADMMPAGEKLLGTSPTSRLMASIPVLLAAGNTPEIATAGWTPTKVTLGVTWLAVLAAVLAIWVVLRKSMELGDRRGRFVSAVTHELRTPLTTFCLYTEMLSEGMVTDEASRSGYLATLRGESRRLAGIVENVLEYARLGGKKPPKSGPTVFARDLVSRMEPALMRCAEQCGMRLVVEGMPDPTLRVSADQQTVERILLNLVDNACKYAGDSADRRVHLVAGSLARAGRAYLELRVRDHGPGIAAADAKRIFRPFHRGKRDAGGPKSGLGLGLALARGLARELGGDLTVAAPGPGRGAEFVLVLPA